MRKSIINALAEEYLWPEHQFRKRVQERMNERPGASPVLVLSSA